MTVLNNDCQRALELSLSGASLNNSDRLFVDRHLKSCITCKIDLETFALLSDDPSHGNTPPLDDISRRRFVDNILDRSEEIQTVPKEDKPNFNASLGNSRSALWAASAAILIGIISVLVFNNRQKESLEPAPPVIQPLTGKILLVAGHLENNGKSTTVLDTLSTADLLKTGAGNAAISLSSDVMISMNSNTILEFQQMDSSAIVLNLLKGEVLLSATPGRTGPKLLVQTRKGIIAITGTILTVSDTGASVEVSVLRGKVKTTSNNAQRARKITSGSTWIFGESEARTLSKTDRTACWQIISTLELLKTESAGIVSITSEPTGAEVKLDGDILGLSPLTAAIRPGHRRLELSVNGKIPIREYIDVSISSKTLERSFELLSPENNISKGTLKAKPLPYDLARQPTGPGELLVKAQTLKAQKNWKGSARLYKELIRRYPTSGEARSSLVSLGQIQLGMLGKPRAALARFNTYLNSQSNGPLALEAMWGKVGAMGKLGKTTEEQVAIKNFLTRFPNALQSSEAKERLEKISP